MVKGANSAACQHFSASDLAAPVKGETDDDSASRAAGMMLVALDPRQDLGFINVGG